MKISGFTFCRNAVKYDYPVVESIRSALPVCDEFIVNVGRCDDGTLALIESIRDPRIKSFLYPARSSAPYLISLLRSLNSGVPAT